jgi:hypothetical protein
MYTAARGRPKLVGFSVLKEIFCDVLIGIKLLLALGHQKKPCCAAGLRATRYMNGAANGPQYRGVASAGEHADAAARLGAAGMRADACADRIRIAQIPHCTHNGRTTVQEFTKSTLPYGRRAIEHFYHRPVAPTICSVAPSAY